MSKTTTLIIKKKKVSFLTQQYVTGLYFALYTDGIQVPQQGVSDLKEDDFHRSLRESAKKNKDKFVLEEPTVLN